MNIISASRRTDIPHYYAEWFRERRRAGYAEYRTVYGGGRTGAFRASLAADDVLGYLFWTKYAGPFHGELDALRAEGMPYVFHYTISGYGEDLQPGIPSRDHAIHDFLRIADGLPGAASIQWRYDPILVSPGHDGTWHRKNFEEIAKRLKGAVHVVNVSFVEPYLKALSKAPDWKGIVWRRPDPGRHGTLLKNYPGLRAAGIDEELLLADLSTIAREQGMELRVCCNPEYSAHHPVASCCGPEMFKPYGESLLKSVSTLAANPSRPGCHCLKSIDIGMDTTCPGGCFYCYAATSHRRARMNYGLHDPTATMLRS